MGDQEVKNQEMGRRSWKCEGAGIQSYIPRGQLENLQSELATPTQFKGRLNELLSQVRPGVFICGNVGEVPSRRKIRGLRNKFVKLILYCETN